jgi:hypothetical protein
MGFNPAGGRPPLSWVSGNVVYARGLDDAWGVWKVPTVSYEMASLQRRTAQFRDLRAFCEEINADFQVLRLSGAWDAERYLATMLERPPADAHHGLREAYLLEQADTLGVEVDELGGEWERELFGPPQVFVAVSLRDPARHRSEVISDAVAGPLEQLRALRARGAELGLGRRDELALERLEQDHAKADEVFGQRVLPFMPDARAASLREIEWMVRRAWCRGLGEPFVTGLDEPGALRFERNGQAMLRPDTADLLSWGDYIHRRRGDLELIGELGTSWQAGLVAQGMPGEAPAPSRLLELMFVAPEALGFPVDLALNAEFITNPRAKAQGENKITDADENAKEEAASERGLSDETGERMNLSRDARNYFRAGHPRLDCVLSVMCGAQTPKELRRRVKAITQAYRSHQVTLRQPVGQQLEVFFGHLPAQRAWVKGYTRHLTPDQVGAMAPLAAHRVGSPRRGYAWGHTLNGTPGVFRWNPGDASIENKAAGVLLLGDSGAGKTLTAAKIATEAFLEGGRIFDLTAKPADHHWHEAEEIAPHVEAIELRGDASLAGLLDPWLTAPPELRVDAATDFLLALFPERYPHQWDSHLTIAIARLAEASRTPSNIELLRVLRDSGEAYALEVAEHLEAQVHHGLSQLGFADLARRQHRLGQRQVTHVMCQGLQLPEAGVKRENYRRSERLGEALVQLLGLLCMSVMGEYPDELKLFSYDEAHVLLDNALGRQILDRMQRLGRSQHVVPAMATQNATDIGVDRESVTNLFGSIWCFRPPDELQAKAALTLMGVEASPATIKRLLELPDGAALLRDHQKRSEFVQVKHVPSVFARVRTDRRPDAPVR